MSDPIQINSTVKRELIDRAVNEILWYEYHHQTVAVVDNSDKAQKKLLKELSKYGLVTIEREGSKDRHGASYVAANELKSKIQEDRDNKAEKEKKIFIRKAEGYAGRDGEKSVLDWVVANIPYRKSEGVVFLADEDVSRSRNPEMVEALEYTDSRLQKFNQPQYGIRYRATGELADIFLEKGTLYKEKVKAEKVRYVDFKAKANHAGSDANNLLDGARQTGQVIQLQRQALEK